MGSAKSARVSPLEVFVVLLVIGIGVALVWIPGQDVIPAWRAKLGWGVVGTFTAERKPCQVDPNRFRTTNTRDKYGQPKKTCHLSGSWVAADGSRRRDDVRIHNGPKELALGGTTEAWDTGDRLGVYARGGFNYLWQTVLFVIGVVILTAMGIAVFREVRSKRAGPKPEA
ncbi:hypothetical protein [Mycobacterium spongiae]|uniref:Uncharacterized protein n=1 Tax=Mycobacterium spongiae TaxID=886343 RepID=A0A975PY62_9MYCO|nr:hypothetical protein [Mycobacterium spongiae]QUR68981.1 hypothetical protein F6B93_19600 [Mycobacterium spongiae]